MFFRRKSLRLLARWNNERNFFKKSYFIKKPTFIVKVKLETIKITIVLS